MEKKNLKSLTLILDEEIYSFKQLLKYEKLKNQVIIKQEVDKLKKLSRNEEELLDKVARLEEKREHVVDSLFKEYNINSDKILTSLLKILPSDKENFKEILHDRKEELIRNIKDLRHINEINNKLLMDSIKFFSYAVNSIQDMDSVTYDQTGAMPKDYDNCWVINKRV